MPEQFTVMSRPFFLLAVVVDGFGDELLAGSRLSVDEDGCLGGRGHFDLTKTSRIFGLLPTMLWNSKRVSTSYWRRETSLFSSTRRMEEISVSVSTVPSAPPAEFLRTRALLMTGTSRPSFLWITVSTLSTAPFARSGHSASAKGAWGQVSQESSEQG